MVGYFHKAVAYIRQNLEQYEIDHGWANICKHYPLPCDIADKIIGLLDEFGEDNGLEEDWWVKFGGAEDFFTEID